MNSCELRTCLDHIASPSVFRLRPSAPRNPDGGGNGFLLHPDWSGRAFPDTHGGWCDSPYQPLGAQVAPEHPDVSTDDKSQATKSSARPGFPSPHRAKLAFPSLRIPAPASPAPERGLSPAQQAVVRS